MRKHGDRNVGERIKKLREKLDLTQREFGRRIGVMDTVIRRWEKGEFEPTSEKLRAIANEFGVNLNWLLLGKGNMFLNGEEQEGKNHFERAGINPELYNFIALLSEEQQKQLADVFKEVLKNSFARSLERIFPPPEEKQSEDDRISKNK